jgi:hypothetical protein
LTLLRNLETIGDKGCGKSKGGEDMRLTLALVVAALLALAMAAPASSHQASPTGVEHCNAAVEKQVNAGVQAGGGPKAGIDGPLNCDHFFFAIGVIGNENSGGP